MNVGLRCLKPMHCLREFKLLFGQQAKKANWKLEKLLRIPTCYRAGFETQGATSERGYIVSQSLHLFRRRLFLYYCLKLFHISSCWTSDFEFCNSAFCSLLVSLKTIRIVFLIRFLFSMNNNTPFSLDFCFHV